MVRVAYILILITLTGCTIPGRYYLRNRSDLPATLTIILDKSLVFGNREITDLRFTNEIKNIKFGLHEKLDKLIKGQVINDDSVRFIIPPKSTVYLGHGANFSFWAGFKKGIIKVGDKEDSFDINSSEQMNISSTAMFNYTGYYDILL